jgi:aminomethyltransferase
LEENVYRWTAADPSLRWFTQNAAGLDVSIEDISESVAALALQGPTSGRLLKSIADVDIENLKYFRVTSGLISGIAVDISRTGYTGDLGYEVWVNADDALRLWDILIERGRPFDIKPAGMLALDVARIEAGLLLIDIDFNSSKKALIADQKYSPAEMGLGRLVNLDKHNFVGQQALLRESKRAPAKQIVGLEIDWNEVEQHYEVLGLPPAVSPIASRVAVPIFKNGKQIGKATSSTWSPVLKKMIALATLQGDFTAPGSTVEIETTVEAVRHRVPARVVKTPYYNPKHKTATPV